MSYKRIYLQVKDLDGNKIDPESGEVTWCVDQINDSDIEYVRADLLTAAQERLKAV